MTTPATIARLIALVGLGVAGYLTYEHFTGSTTLACSESGVVNCQKVTTSVYSSVGGVPLALLGVAFFAAMFGLWVRHPRLSTPLLRRLRFGLSLVGVIGVLYLVFVELFRLNAICLWCTGVHALALVLFALDIIETTGPTRRRD